MMKRSFDFLLAGLGILLLLPFFGLVFFLIKMDSPGPFFFRQERMGREFRPFLIYKFRTMVQDAPSMGGLITAGQDPRITRIGRLLRKTKIDELPQLFNVLKGDMSFVGPRPEVRRYVELFDRDYREILKVRPGITDLASLEYHQEAAVLGGAVNPEEMYVTKILPHKIRLAKEYLERSSFLFDMSLIVRTVLRIAGSR